MTGDIERLTRRHERERRARLQAEEIAEKAIADLVESNAELDQRVQQRTAQLRDALDRLATADRLRSTLVRGLAHEMRTPLHAIGGLVEVVADRTDDPDLAAAAKVAGEAAARLNLALRALIEFAALSAGDRAVTAAPIRLGSYADRVLERWRLPAARAGMLLVSELRPDPSVVVEADEARLDQIVDGLIDNAIRFGATPIQLTLARVDGGAPELVIRVEDSGPGVEEAVRRTLFDAFVRGDDDSPGFGIGLTLGRAVAELLRGSLELVEPTDGPGATFVARVPLRPDVS